jgi:hypothetical protein
MSFSYGSLLPHQESLSVRLRLEGPQRQPLPQQYDVNDVDNDQVISPSGIEGGTSSSIPSSVYDPNESYPQGHASLFSCFLNLVNTVVGAGMLGLPGALGGTGYLTGCWLMLMGAIFSAQGLVLLSMAAQQAGLPSSFYSVARAAVPEYTVLIDCAVAFKCFGGKTSQTSDNTRVVVCTPVLLIGVASLYDMVL